MMAKKKKKRSIRDAVSITFNKDLEKKQKQRLDLRKKLAKDFKNLVFGNFSLKKDNYDVIITEDRIKILCSHTQRCCQFFREKDLSNDLVSMIIEADEFYLNTNKSLYAYNFLILLSRLIQLEKDFILTSLLKKIWGELDEF